MEYVNLYVEDYNAAKRAGYDVRQWDYPDPQLDYDLYLLLRHNHGLIRVEAIMKPDGTYEPVLRREDVRRQVEKEMKK